MSAAQPFVSAGFDSLPAHIAILDDEGWIVYTNEAWNAFGEAQTDSTECPGVGSNYLAVCDASDDETARAVLNGIRSIVIGEQSSFSLEYPCHTPSEHHWFMMEAVPYDVEGERHVLVTHTDITARWLAERRAQEHASRMEAFARLLSHDLRNPLSVALGEVSLLELESERVADGPLRPSLERMESIIDDALVLATTDGVKETRPIRLETLAEEGWKHVKTDGATLIIDGDAGVRTDPDIVGHLFENLFRNAIEHGPPEGSASTPTDVSGDERDQPTLTVRVGPLPSTENGNRPDRELEGFFVEDDGQGIPESKRERVFESGYTTTGDGTGLGLAIVSHVVDIHDWSIEATEGPTGGARFEITNVDTIAINPGNL